MNPSLLWRLLLWDIRQQAREHIYLFTGLTTGMFVAVVTLLPNNGPATVITAILFLDPAIVGAAFTAGLVLLERSQNTPPALAVTPVSATGYVVAKLITFTLLTIAGGLAIITVAYWPPSAGLLMRMALALTFTGVLGVLGGLVMVATAHSLNHLIARAFPVSVVLYLPFFAHFGAIQGWLAWMLFGINPGHAMLLALLWAADPGAVSAVEIAYAFGYMSLVILVLFRWALVLHIRTIGHASS